MSNLDAIERRGVAVPHYDRAALTPRILHIGVGGFHRDNLAGNGNVAREAITRVCEGRSEDLARYVETACSFPNSMVDRITPQTTDDDRAWLQEEFGVEDGWPVVAESFRQWVLEDSFVA